MEFSNEEKVQQNTLVSKLCDRISPRYHISAGGKSFFRMSPFKNRKGQPTHFINVAEIENQLPKDKYLVAIQFNPKEKEETQMMESPFLQNESQKKLIVRKVKEKN